MAPTIQSIAGTLIHGSLLTIISTGTDFSSHADWNAGSDTWQGRDFICRAWKDVEDAVLESDQFGITAGTSSQFQIVSSPVRTNSTRSIRRYYNNSELGALGVYQSSDHTEWYANWWVQFSSDIVSNTKSCRIWSDGTNDVTLFVFGGTGSKWGGTDGLVTEWGDGPNVSKSVWHHMEFYMRNISIEDHGVWLWMNGTLCWSHINEEDVWPPLVPYNDGGHTWDLIDYFDGPNGSSYWDDLYLDHTRARVEIGDSETYATCTQREIQIPVTWSTSQVGISVNQGAFGSSANGWLYVVDSSGNVSDGEPIQFGETYGNGEPDFARIVSGSMGGGHA